MKRMTPIAGPAFSLLSAISSTAMAADAFPYDRAEAVGLARVYLGAHVRRHPEAAAQAAGAPFVSSARAARHRRLVFVSFAAEGASSGGYVELELCAETALLTVVDVGTVDDIAAYRRDAARIGPSVFVASPAVCPARQE